MLRHLIFLFCVCCAKSELLNLDEGSNCTWKGVPGTCVGVYHCETSFLDKMNKDYAPICSFRGKEPIICCTDCDIVEDASKMVWHNKLGILIKTGEKAQEKCVDYMLELAYPCKNKNETLEMVRLLDPNENCYDLTVPRVPQPASVGINADREEFPHMALLGYGDNITTADWLCGGTVISEKFILTAGHCLYLPEEGSVKYVALGILRRSDPPELWQKYNVMWIHPFPEYRPSSKYHDIGLLETETTISFNNKVLPACLHWAGGAAETASATSWGAQMGHRRELADNSNLQTVTVFRESEEQCSYYYPPKRDLEEGYDPTIQMCYGDKYKPKDICEGDSGGPLQSTWYDRHGCVYTIIGVTSYGRQCGGFGGAGLYTRVYFYVPWIESIVWPEQDPENQQET